MTGMGEYDASKPSEPLATINCIEKAICITLDWQSDPHITALRFIAVISLPIASD
jgi:hypothetical protein